MRRCALSRRRRVSPTSGSGHQTGSVLTTTVLDLTQTRRLLLGATARHAVPGLFIQRHGAIPLVQAVESSGFTVGGGTCLTTCAHPVGIVARRTPLATILVFVAVALTVGTASAPVASARTALLASKIAAVTMETCVSMVVAVPPIAPKRSAEMTAVGASAGPVRSRGTFARMVNAARPSAKRSNVAATVVGGCAGNASNAERPARRASASSLHATAGSAGRTGAAGRAVAARSAGCASTCSSGRFAETYAKMCP